MERLIVIFCSLLSKLKKGESFSFLSQSANYMFSTILIRGMQFLTIPIMTALLTPSEYGILGIYTSIVSVFITVIGLNFDSATVRFFYDKPEEYEDFFKSVNLFVTIIGALMVCIIFLFRQNLANYFGVDEDIVLFATITPYFNNCYTMFLSTLQAQKQSKKYLCVTLIQRLSALGLTIILMYVLSSDKYLGKIYAEIIVCIVTFCLLFKKFYKGAKINLKYVKYAAHIGIPLIPHVLSSFILSYFARITLNNVRGLEEAGLFSFAEDIGMVMMIVSMSFNKAWTPIFYEKMNSKDYKGISVQTNRIIKISILLAIFLLFFAKEMVMLLADERYYAALSVVPIIIVGKAFGPLYTIYSHFSDYFKRTGYISVGTLFVGVLNLIMNSVFIPKFGAIAGACNAMLCSIMLFVCHFLISRFILKIEFLRLLPLLKNYCWLFIAAIIFFVGVNYLSTWGFIAIRIVYLIIVLYIIFLKNALHYCKKNIE